MKILHLVLYSDDKEYYRQMYNLTSKYYKTFSENVDTYYYKFDNNIVEDVLLEGNILKFKGIETYIPGILDKTIKAFKYFESGVDNYDYILRSNISTVINFSKLIDYLTKKKIDLGMYYFIRGLFANRAGIANNNNVKMQYKYVFQSGTSMLFNKVNFKMLLNNIDKINKNLIDDVSIGKLLYDLKIISIDKIKKSLNEKNIFLYINKNNIYYSKDYLILRNRNRNRNNDVKNIKQIINFLLNNNTIKRNITKRNIIKRNIIKRNITKRNITKRNITKRNIIKRNKPKNIKYNIKYRIVKNNLKKTN